MLLIQVSQSSCTNDKLADPSTINNPVCDSLQATYDLQIKPIIDNSCAFVGCHAANSPFGDLTSYANMSFYLNDNFFKKRVIDIMDMPEGDMLSPEEFELVNCWVIDGYPEN